MSNPIRDLFGLEQRNTVDYQTVFGGALDFNTGSRTAAGKTVSAASAMQLSSVYACVRILSEGISTLPVNTSIRSAGTRKPFLRPDWLLFQDGPYSKIDVFGQMMTSLLLDRKRIRSDLP